MRIVRIDWRDAYGASSDWVSIDGLKPTPLLVHSVGYLLHDGLDVKVIVPHLCDAIPDHVERQGCGDMTIPSSSIVGMTVLEEDPPQKKKRIRNR